MIWINHHRQRYMLLLEVFRHWVTCLVMAAAMPCMKHSMDRAAAAVASCTLHSDGDEGHCGEVFGVWFALGVRIYFKMTFVSRCSVMFFRERMEELKGMLSES